MSDSTDKKTPQVFTCPICSVEFGAEKTYQEHIKTHETQNVTQEQGSNGTLPQPASAQEDPALSAKMAELDAAIRRTNELNAKMEAQMKEQSEAFNSGRKITPEEQQSVIEAHKTKAEIIKEKLKAQPRVRIFVPLEGKEKLGQQLPITINGYAVKIPKGVYVEVPMQIGEIVTDSLNQTQQALDNPLRLDLDEKKADILA